MVKKLIIKNNKSLEVVNELFWLRNDYGVCYGDIVVCLR